MKYKLIASLLFISCFVFGQNKKSSQLNPIISNYQINPRLKGDFSFTQKWDYPWWVIRNEDGHFESSMSDSITHEDTLHIYQTADVTTSHQGNHIIKYVEAILKKDTLFLDFADLDAAYHGWLQIQIVKDKFTSEWSCIYIMKMPGEKIIYTTTKQKLILTTNQFEIGKKIRGKINIQFKENFSAPNYPSSTTNHFVKGYFETTILVPPKE